MSSMTESDSSRRKYSKISINRRAKLVQLIIENGYTIAKAGKRLGIKASTARMILNKYKQTGDFPMKNFKKIISVTSKNTQSPLKEITLPINEEENVDLQRKNQVSQNCNEPSMPNQLATETTCNWMYLWVYPDYTPYPCFIL